MGWGWKVVVFVIFPLDWQRIIGRMGHYSTRLALSVVVIYIAYIGSAYLTQKLFTHPYPHTSLNRDGSHKAHRFAHPALLAATSCALCALVGLLHSLSTRPRPNPIPPTQQARLGLLFTLNYLPTTYSLLYVSYPVQLVGKNARYLFVVLVGVFFSRVKASKELSLPAKKVVIAVLVTAGTLLFMWFEGGRKGQRGGQMLGYGLLLLAVVSDALFADSQAYCKAAFRPSPWHLFTSANLWAGGLIFLFALLTGSLVPSIKFCLKHSGVSWDILLICLLQACGQVAIYYVVGNFKQHVYPLVSTTRKVFTVLLSVLLFGHMLNAYQWAAVGLLVVAMGVELQEEIAIQEEARNNRKKEIEAEEKLQMIEAKRGRQARERTSRPNSPLRSPAQSPINSPRRSSSPLPRITISSPH